MLEVKKNQNGTTIRSSSRTSTVLAYAEPRTQEFSEQRSFSPMISAGAAVGRAKITPPAIVGPVSDIGDQQTKIPVIVGEARYKGTMPVDGIITGQLGPGASLNVRQRSRATNSVPELAGEISFRDMLRVNGHIAGTVYSKAGTLIVDTTSQVDANVEVAVAVISGSVNGDIVAHQRVEIGPNAKIHGNIWTRSIQIKDGAIFEGECKMIGD